MGQICFQKSPIEMAMANLNISIPLYVWLEMLTATQKNSLKCSSNLQAVLIVKYLCRGKQDCWAMERMSGIKQFRN